MFFQAQSFPDVQPTRAQSIRAVALMPVAIPRVSAVGQDICRWPLYRRGAICNSIRSLAIMASTGRLPNARQVTPLNSEAMISSGCASDVSLCGRGNVSVDLRSPQCLRTSPCSERRAVKNTGRLAPRTPRGLARSNLANRQLTRGVNPGFN